MANSRGRRNELTSFNMRIVDNRSRQLLERIGEIHDRQRIRIGRERVKIASLKCSRKIVEVIVEIGCFRDVLEVRLLLHELNMQLKGLLKSLRKFRNAVADERSIQEESTDTSSRSSSNPQTTCVVPSLDRSRGGSIRRFCDERLDGFE